MSSYTETNNTAQDSPCEFTQNLEILRQIPLFAGLPLEAVKVLAYLCVRERFRAGDMVFSQDEVDGSAFFIVSGQGTLLRFAESGQHEVGHVVAGRFLGGLTLLGDTLRLFSLRADVEMVCLVLSREKFCKTQEQFPDMLPRVAEALVKEVRSFELSILDKTAALVQNYQHWGVSLI
ncbi:MAG: Crp/Fnr family transcriptional regulator [Desulfovibrio sp.]|uniref:Crp/Fnr family transcriptional regulator n=1 Tax=Desulfovibrio sp. 7SRBS1 TaxID=3378064 RepID=UPI003B3F8A64